MGENTPKGIVEFPLTEMTARYIVNDLAENYTSRIRWSRHVKQRMLERGLAAGKIIELTVVLKNHQDSPSSVLVTVWVD